MVLTFDFTGSAPTLMELVSFPLPDKVVNFAVEIGTEYRRFGVLLLNDTTGMQISALEREHGQNATAINYSIFQLWLTGKGRQPASWDILVDVLQKVKLNMLAESIERIKLSNTH